MFVKVQGLTVVKFPYSILDLMEENPYTSYDDRFSLAEWHEKTENAVLKNEKVFSVLVENEPNIDLSLYRITRQTIPTFTNNNWVLGWDVVEITEQEKQAMAASQEESTPTQA